MIDHAQSRLDVIDPYVSDPDTLDRIAAAARRGAQVRFIVPLDSNAPAALGIPEIGRAHV